LIQPGKLVYLKILYPLYLMVDHWEGLSRGSYLPQNCFCPGLDPCIAVLSNFNRQ
jgi:hypothetical protein